MIRDSIIIFSIFFITCIYGCAKKKEKYTGFVFNLKTNKPIKGVLVVNNHDTAATDSLGYFAMPARHNGPLFFKKQGFEIDSANTYVNHSGEFIEMQFDLGKIYLTPFSNKGTLKVHNYTMDQKFYSRKNGESAYEMVMPAGFSIAKYTDRIIPVKEDNYNYNIAPGDPFIKTTQLYLNNVPCKLIVYTTAGENDTRILNFQINSYNEKNKIIDALLLDSRFTFDIEYYSQYEIYRDGKIQISRFSINKYEQNEEGDLIGEKAEPDTTEIKKIFQLKQNGAFVEVVTSKLEVFDPKWIGSYYGSATNKDQLLTSFKLDVASTGNCSLTYIADGEAEITYRNIKVIAHKNSLKVNFDPKNGAIGVLNLHAENGSYYFSGDPVYTINPGREQLSAQKQSLNKTLK